MQLIDGIEYEKKVIDGKGECFVPIPPSDWEALIRGLNIGNSFNILVPISMNIIVSRISQNKYIILRTSEKGVRVCTWDPNVFSDLETTIKIIKREGGCNIKVTSPSYYIM